MLSTRRHRGGLRMTDRSTQLSGTADHASGPIDDVGCCVADGEVAPVARGGRYARGAAGVAFLLVAGALGGRTLRGGVALWPVALVPTWFGISHLVAAATGYPGCPELGAIPSVMVGRE